MTELSNFSEVIFKRTYAFTPEETWDQCALRVAKFVAQGNSELETEFYWAISNRKFIPGGRYLYSSGRELANINNCFLLKAKDSREGWGELLNKHVIALSTGGGVGTDYSDLRAKGTPIRRYGGTASGPTSLMQMVNEVARHVMAGGTRRCLPKGTLIQMKNGVKKIEDIKIGDTVKTSTNYCKVLDTIYQGEQNLFKIKTQLGEFWCTGNHRIAVLNSLNKYDFKQANNLCPGDRLVFARHTNLGELTNIEPFIYERPPMSTTCKDITIPFLNEELAWFFGYFHGNGHVTVTRKSGVVSIVVPEEFYLIKDKLIEIIKKFSVNITYLQLPSEEDRSFKINIKSKQLGLFLSRYKTSHVSIDIPEFITKATLNIRAAYLAGLFDADGCCKSRPLQACSSVYPKYLEQVSALYASMGIPATLKESYSNDKRILKGWKPLFNLNLIGMLTVQDFINKISEYSFKWKIHSKSTLTKGMYDFTFPASWVGPVKSGKKTYKTWASPNVTTYRCEVSTGSPCKFIPVEVLSIEETIITAETFDISTEHQEFVLGNGLVVHNSALWAGLRWSHPDLLDFIKLKNWSTDVKALKERDFSYPAPLDMMNVSVNLDDDFFKYVQKDTDVWNLYYSIVKTMCKTGEPGFAINLKDQQNQTLRNPCNEVVSEDDSDCCNLGSVVLPRIDNIKELKRVVRLGTRFLYLGTSLGFLPHEDFYKIRTQNKRIGLGIMGLHDWCLKHGVGYEPSGELGKWLSCWTNISDDEAEKCSNEYSLPYPKGRRAVAPTGTIGIIGETSTGIEPVFCVSYKRRFLDGGKYKYSYIIDPTAEKAINEYNIHPDDIEDAYKLSTNVEKRLAMQAFVQDFTDQAISSTINLPEWGESGNNNAKQFAETLLKYLPRLRGITVYPDGSRPGQPITPVLYSTAKKQTGTVYEESSERCNSGVCGI